VLGRTPERGNLIARLPGASGQSRLLLISHTDVVPVGDASTWNRAPFGGEIVDGRLYGRGSSDMKGTAAAEVMALILLKRAGIAPRHTITLTCVADEEAGGAYGMGWLVREHADRVRSDYSLNEGGGGFVSLGGQLHCMVGLGEKGRYEAVYDVHGRAAHAAHPWRGENAFFRLGQLLRGIEKYQAERRTDNPFFTALRPLLAPEIIAEERITPQNVDALADRLESVNMALAGACRGLSRLTLTPSILHGGIKSNSVPDRVRLVCDLRSVPGQSTAYLEDELRRIAHDIPGVEVALIPTAEPSLSPVREPYMAALRESIRAAVGSEVAILPSTTSGFTDSRFPRELGTVAYGCVPGSPASSSEPHNAHGPDEWTSVDELIIATRFFVDAAYRIAVEGVLDA
jgi:acetylornithine deacetylase/succinyl-diaminopimelate desuccinylase-like protein